MTSIDRVAHRLRAASTLLAVLALVTGLLTNAAWAQVAGRMVLSVGDVVAVRGSERVRLPAGTDVNVGDAVVTGAQSHAQIRFSDEALVALKPDSEFRIEQYNFAGRTDGSERAVFRLVRGGFRTVTGAIGRVNTDTYQVQTTQATIGIRGTHYALQICAINQCRDAPGEPYFNSGLYGGVYAGLVGVANPLGGGEYGAREFFYVPDGEAPRRWLVPPLFLANDLSGREYPKREASTELAFAKVPELPIGPALPLPPFVYVAAEDLRNPQPQNPNPPAPPPPLPGERSIVVGSDRYTIELDRTPNAHLALNATGALTGFSNTNLNASLSTAQLTDVGSDVAGGAQINWGRWAGAGSTIVQQLPDGTSVSNNGGNLHYVYGNVATALPSSGVIYFTPVGGTHPTDSTTGATGALVSGGSVSVDFTAARVGLTGLTIGFSDANYTMSGNGSLLNGLFSSSPIGTTVACAGAACKPLVAGNFAGFLAGPGGSGLGLDYFFNIPGGVIEGVTGYRKCPGAVAC